MPDLRDWIPTETRLPEEGQRVQTMNSRFEVTDMTYHEGLWFLDSGIYVYYTPTAWKPLTQ